MATKRPIALYEGRLKELQSGDVVAGATGGAGVLLQVRYVRDTTQLYLSAVFLSIKSGPPPGITEGVGYPQLTLPFTPVAANSLLEVSVSIQTAARSLSATSLALFDSGSVTPEVAVEVSNLNAQSNTMTTIGLTCFVLAGSVAERTFSVRLSTYYGIEVNSVSSYANARWVPAISSYISVKEYAQ
jgi:hypothetical protein